MKKTLLYFLPALLLLSGCHSNPERQPGQPLATSNSKSFQLTDYATSDPRLDPTLRIGGVLDVRTTNGSPVVLQSQLDRQRKATEQLRANAEIIQPTSSQAKP